MTSSRLNGLIAATYTPLHSTGELRLDQIGPLVEHLIADGIQGLYVCGSTGEGVSLSTSERKQVAEEFIKANAGRVPVIVQVGHNSLEEAVGLTRHAEQIGADIVSATCPSYFKASDGHTLTACMAKIAGAAPETPFYYYHIPVLTGSTIDIVEFLELGRSSIPTLAGLKYTDTRLFEFQKCQTIADGTLDIVFGCDEMLLSAVATGATAAIGSTYNLIAGIYLDVMQSVAEGDLQAARIAQLRSVEFVRMMNKYPFHPAMKAALTLRGIEMGPCRLPQRELTEGELTSLRTDLAAWGLSD